MYQMTPAEQSIELFMQKNSKQEGRLLPLVYKQIPLALICLIVVACNGKSDNGQQKNNRDTVEKTAEAPVLTKEMLAGQKVYEEHCLTCHQSNGGGVPNLNPPLKGTEYVLGEKNRLISIVLKGSNEGLEIDGETFDNAMPPHNFLSDDEVAQVLSYVRNSFGNEADTVTTEEVKTVRAKIK